jgi:hypothetical protein
MSKNSGCPACSGTLSDSIKFTLTMPAGAMLMRPHDGGVDHGVFFVGIGRELGKYSFPDTGFCPSAETAMDVLPVAEAFRKIAPRNPRAIPKDHGLDKQPVLRRRHLDMVDTPRQVLRNRPPLIVSQSVASHLSAPNQLTPQESRFAPRRDPLIDDMPKS